MQCWRVPTILVLSRLCSSLTTSQTFDEIIMPISRQPSAPRHQCLTTANPSPTSASVAQMRSYVTTSASKLTYPSVLDGLATAV